MKSNILKKMCLIVVIVMLSSLFLGAANNSREVTILKDLIKPDAILVKNNTLYVLEKTSIFLYSLQNFHLLKRFGREGEGPMEFIARPFGPPMTLSFYADYLVVNSSNKISYFTLTGDYVKEEKCPPNTVFYRLKEGYLGIGAAGGDDQRQYISFRLYNLDFQEPVLLYRTEISLGGGADFLVPMNPLNYYPIYQGKIFIIADGFAVDSFDSAGKKLTRIEKNNYERINVSEAYRKNTLEWFQSHPYFKTIFPQIKNRIKFKEYYPALKSISVDNNWLYVITNKRQDKEWECIKMDMGGKELKSTFVPLQDSEPYTYYPLLYFIENGKYYALIENPDEETWELHVKSLK